MAIVDFPIREISDHATFKEKEDTLGWLGKPRVFLSLALWDLAIFDQLYLPKYLLSFSLNIQTICEILAIS